MGVIYAGLFAGTILNGFTVGILWASANQYIADCSSDSNKGFYFSYFWSFYMTSQIFGNLAASFLLGTLNQEAYFFIMAGVSAIATFCFIFVRKPDRVAKLDSKLEGLALVEESLDRSESTGTDYVEQTVIYAVQ